MSNFGAIGHHLIVAIIDHIPNGWVMFNGDMTNDPCSTQEVASAVENARAAASEVAAAASGPVQGGSFAVAVQKVVLASSYGFCCCCVMGNRHIMTSFL